MPYLGYFQEYLCAQIRYFELHFAQLFYASALYVYSTGQGGQLPQHLSLGEAFETNFIL